MGNWIEHEWDKITHHHGDSHRLSQTGGQSPVTIEADTGSASKETTVGISADIKQDLTEGIEYIDGWIDRVKAAAPGIVSTVDTVANSTVGKLAEALGEAILPPQVEEVVVNLVKAAVDKYGQAASATTAPAPTATATPAQAPAAAAAPATGASAG